MKIKTKPTTPEYRKGWDRIFNKKILDSKKSNSYNKPKK